MSVLTEGGGASMSCIGRFTHRRCPPQRLVSGTRGFRLSGRSPGFQVELMLRGNHLPMPKAQWRIGLPFT